MEILHDHTDFAGTFTAMDQEKVAGILHYTSSEPSDMTIVHTEVKPDYNGKGVGKLLLAEAVAFATKNKMKITPLCMFAMGVFKRDLPKYKSILA